MVLEQLAALVNRNIAASSRAQALCKQLEGRMLGLTVEGLQVKVFVLIEAQALRLLPTAAREPDVTISGTPLSLLALAGRDAPQRLRSGAVAISGDAEVAQAFNDLLRAVRPDLEEELARVVGDVAAHQIGNAARAAFSWGRKASNSMAANVSEYLQEESRDLVTRPEMEEFLAAVDTLREAGDRLAAHVDLLDDKQT